MPDVVLVLLYCLVCNSELEFITSACIYILCVHHLSLGSDWPSAGEYGGVLFMYLASICTTHYRPRAKKLDTYWLWLKSNKRPLKIIRTS